MSLESSFLLQFEQATHSGTTEKTLSAYSADVLWEVCLRSLQEKLSVQQFNTWIHPLQAALNAEEFIIFAPNRFVKDWVKDHYLQDIKQILIEYTKLTIEFTLSILVGSKKNLQSSTEIKEKNTEVPIRAVVQTTVVNTANTLHTSFQSYLNPEFTFEKFVEGKSTQLAVAASKSVAADPGGINNPLLIYGGVGLGKTHLMHAVGNCILKNKQLSRVRYMHAERFVAEMVKALQNNKMNDFKNLYRQVDALLIDDIQFFAGKDRSQEEFFHTFNALLEGRQQIILTCDRYPKEINGLEERLKSRFGWGLTVAVEPPELETRVAILMRKAEQSALDLPYEVAFFIAKRIRSNVRELEGALKRVIANAKFTGHEVTMGFVKESLKDLFTLQDKLVSVDNIIKTVAQYYKVKVVDLLSVRRHRSLARPRQMAMTLSKELTNQSLPEIGAAFGGRDHTTVLHAIRKIHELREINVDIAEDYKNLMRILTT